MVRDGVRLQLGAKLLSAKRSGDERVLEYERDGRRERMVADQILVATGRRPNVESLELERAGVRFTDKGVVVDHRLRTSNRNVYAVGDVCSPYQFTHVADAHARIVVQNALFFGRARADRWCTYTSPEIAHVGMYEEDARRAGIACETHTKSIEELDRAVLDGSNEGFVRVHLKKGTDKILGATIVAEHAGDLISELTLAITAGVGLGRIAGTIHPYPTQGEMVRKVADVWRRTKLTPTAKKIFEQFFRIFR
jgi:pyruvate/2-oxoglutarate dehydrogenase complex dihydrolipoamide dehydrogenase (E3) component